MFNKIQLNYKCLGDDCENVFKSLLNLSMQQLCLHWQHSDNDKAQVVVIDIDNYAGLQLYYAMKRSFKGILVATSIDSEYHKEQALFLAKPFKLKQFISVFQKIREHLGYDEIKVNLDKKEAVIPIYSSQKPSNLIEFLTYHLGYSPLSISHPTKGKLVLFPLKKLYCAYLAEGVSLAEFCQQPFYSLQIRPLIINAAEVYTQCQNNCDPIGQLMWMAALESSDGKLLPYLENYPAYQLHQWPDFNALTYHSLYVRLSGFMINHAFSIEDIATETNISRTKIINFINACAAYGILKEPCNLKKKSIKSLELNNLLGKIRTRLAL